MSLFAKIMVVLNLIFAAVFLAAAGTFLGAANHWKSEHETLATKMQTEIETRDNTIKQQDQQYEVLQGEKNSVSEAKVAVESQLSLLQTSNESLNSKNQALQASLDTFGAAQTDLQSRLSEQQTEISRLNGELSREIAEKRAAQDENATLQANLQRETQSRQDAEAAVAAAEARNTELTAAVSAKETTIAAFIHEFGNLPAGTTMKPLDAVVQSVDNGADIYVLSVGKNDGVQAGWEFTVYRGAKYIATVVVDQVFDEYVSVRTLRGLKAADIQAGDAASTKL